MPLEVERKFLVSRMPPFNDWPVHAVRAFIRQTYLTAPEGESVRVRKSSVEDHGPARARTTTYTHTRKVRVSDGVHEEHEREVTLGEYRRLLREADLDLATIAKTRFTFTWEDVRYELDLFGSPLDRIKMLEVEFPSIEARDAFTPPSSLFLGGLREVTADRGYTNAALARHVADLLKPGPALDAFVHERVFGLCAHDWNGQQERGRICAKCGIYEFASEQPHPPAYSTDIPEAWKVLEKQRLRGEYIQVAPEPEGTWCVGASKALNPREDGTADGYDDTSFRRMYRVPSAAFGICLTAVDRHFDDEHLATLSLCPFCQRVHEEGGCLS